MTPGFIDPRGRIHVPAQRPDVTALKARIQALPSGEKEEVRAWLAAAKIPDSIDASEAQVGAVNAELDRRAALTPPAPPPAAPTDTLF